MKRFPPLLAIAALVSVLAACGGGSKAPTTTSSSAAPTLHAGKLIVGFDLPAPSFWNGQASGTTLTNPAGFEYALALDVAKQLGIDKSNVKLLRAPFGTILLAGKKPYDFAMEETTITAQRAQVIGFSNSYFDANQGVLIAKSVTKPTSIADLKSLQTCAQAATTGLSWILHKLRPAKQPPSTGIVARRLRRGCVRRVPGAHPRRPDHRGAGRKATGRVRRCRRPDRHARGLRRGLRQGKPAHSGRQQGAQDAAVKRDDREADEARPV